jgi:hypothetical protein
LCRRKIDVYGAQVVADFPLFDLIVPPCIQEERDQNTDEAFISYFLLTR